jgi:hypothetical protein
MSRRNLNWTRAALRKPGLLSGGKLSPVFDLRLDRHRQWRRARGPAPHRWMR